MIQRVRNARNKVSWKGKELGIRSVGANDEYRCWVKNRAKEIKLPFANSTSKVKAPITDELLASVPIANGEVEEMRVKLAKAEKEKQEMWK